jgi:hypothetical protein
VGAELFHADGRTDRHMTKPLVAFRNFTNAPKVIEKYKERKRDDLNGRHLKIVRGEEMWHDKYVTLCRGRRWN